MPLHFLNDNILAISALAKHRPGHNAACIRKQGDNGEPFSNIVSLFPFLTSLLCVPILLSYFQRHPPHHHHHLIKSRSLPYDPYKPLQGLVTPRRPEARSYVSLLQSHKWTRCSIACLIVCHEIYAIIPNSEAPQATALSYTGITGTLCHCKWAACRCRQVLSSFQPIRRPGWGTLNAMNRDIYNASIFMTFLCSTMQLSHTGFPQMSARLNCFWILRIKNLYAACLRIRPVCEALYQRVT